MLVFTVFVLRASAPRCRRYIRISALGILRQHCLCYVSSEHSPRHHAAGVDVGDGEALGLAAAGAAGDDHSQALLTRLEHCQLLNIEIT